MSKSKQLSSRLKKTTGKKSLKLTATEPIWKGPIEEGVTQSLISRYLVCPERFRIMAIDGLRPAPTFSQRIEYGSMWHVCEEAFGGGEDWQKALTKYIRSLQREYPTQRKDVVHWGNVCRTQFPIYLRYWGEANEGHRYNLLSEESFAIPYHLPSGRCVTLLGKWDSVDLYSWDNGNRGQIFLQENKTKGDIDERSMKAQLHFDLQTMIYYIALETFKRNDAVGNPWDNPLGGIRYNVVRRPLSGGKGSIRKHKPTKNNPSGESDGEFYARLGSIIEEDCGHFFMRWKIELSEEDVERFERQFLHPVLENLCDDYEWWDYCFTSGMNSWSYLDRAEMFPDHSHRHFRYPFGVWNPMLEGRSSDLDEYLTTGSTTGLVPVDNLFPEL